MARNSLVIKDASIAVVLAQNTLMPTCSGLSRGNGVDVTRILTMMTPVTNLETYTDKYIYIHESQRMKPDCRRAEQQACPQVSSACSPGSDGQSAPVFTLE